MDIYKKLIRPFLFRFTDPEWIHNVTLSASRITGNLAPLRGITKLIFYYEHPMLNQIVAGMQFKSPVGLAAGMDKNADMTRFLPALGFGFEEVGSITLGSYGGNPGKRMVRLPQDKGIIVNYGLSNKGAPALKKHLRNIKKNFTTPVGVSVAKTNKAFSSHTAGLDDWVQGIKLLKDSSDYLTINLSCPNTCDPRNHSKPEHTKKLLAGLKETTFRKPVFLKITSELTIKEADEMITLADHAGFVKGFILTNLNKNRKLLKTSKKLWEQQPGGISGKTVQKQALKLVKHFAKQAGDRYTIIGCGGIFTAKDAYAYIKNGASLVQLVTGLVYEGPGVAKNINKGLVELLQKDGYAHLSEAIGADL